MKHTKNYILARSLKLFNMNGFVNVRLQHIADAVSISVGHLAYHFKNKDAIIETLYDQLKEDQEVILYEFRTAHLFEDINQQLVRISQLQKKYLFFYLDTLEVLRASLEHMKRGTSQHVDIMLIIVEPYFRSLEAAARFRDLAIDLGIKHIFVIANKVRNEEGENAIRQFCSKMNLNLKLVLPFEEKVTEADLHGNSFFDYSKENSVVNSLTAFARELQLN